MIKRNVLDEMQEKQMAKIESTGFWLAFWGLLAAVILQVLIKPDLGMVAGEMAVFFVMCAYLIIFSLRNGLWARIPAPTIKGNVLSSMIAALAFGGVLLIRAHLILRRSFSAGFAAALFLSMALVFAGCFSLLEVTRTIYQRRRRKLDCTGEESEEM